MAAESIMSRIVPQVSRAEWWDMAQGERDTAAWLVERVGGADPDSCVGSAVIAKLLGVAPAMSRKWGRPSFA